jgi:hypothetical protein
MMAADKVRIIPKTSDATAAPGKLEHLKDLKGFMISDPAPDIRGWVVVLPDRRTVGTVDDLVVDTSDRSLRYVEVKAYHDVIGTEDDEWVLVPARTASIDDRGQRVIIERLPVDGFAAAPRFARGVPNKSQEQQIHDSFGVDILGEIIRDELPSGGDQPII